jgi:predicted nucleic acid-binding protein
VASDTWGHLGAEGKRRGRVHPQNDSWIAASALPRTYRDLEYEGLQEISDHHGPRFLG